MNQAVRLKPSFEPAPAEAIAAPAKSRAANSPKSLRTRGRILEAATRLFVEIGYHEATNARIAEAAKLTRGAMLYHFPDRESLIEAVVPYIQAARTRLLQEAMDAAPNGAGRIDYTIEAYWRLLSTTPFTAFSELEGAARTDASLAFRLAAAQSAFDRAEIGEHMFDLIQGAEGPRFQASRDLARFLLEGMARSKLTYDGDARTERLLAIVKRATRILNRKGSTQELWPEG
jgi:AcrR family transcriptional regulator